MSQGHDHGWERGIGGAGQEGSRIEKSGPPRGQNLDETFKFFPSRKRRTVRLAENIRNSQKNIAACANLSSNRVEKAKCSPFSPRSRDIIPT